MFCKNCGSQVREGLKFCESCGTPTGAAPQAQPPQPPRPQAQPPQPPRPQAQPPRPAPYQAPVPPGAGPAAYQPPRKKSNGLIIGIIIGAVVLIGAGVAAFILLQPKPPVVQPVVLNSSLVSEGVDKNDLGNIMNGQFFFDDGTSQYYSSFDSSNMPHIYKMDKASNTSKSIFNGFGWSFVVYKEWLYFSGNQGTAIDGTYNLYRISLDGVKVEKLRDIYCYGLTFNKEWLYYIKQENSASKNYYIARCGLDGTKEEVLVKDGNGYCIIYQDKLYYTGQDGYLYSTNPDGTAKTKVGLEKMFSFIIGGGKLIFIDINKNIRTSDIDGQNVKLIKAAMTPTISKINSYKDTIFYANYDSKRLAHRNAWTYYVYSIKMDGSADTKIREGVSTNAYINVLNDKLYVMDYSSATAKGTMTAIVKSMGLDGTNPVEIFR